VTIYGTEISLSMSTSSIHSPISIYFYSVVICRQKSAHHVVNQNPAFSNSIGDPEVIQQSGSFKRLMWSVLPESSY
jgi:hypothetical protein